MIVDGGGEENKMIKTSKDLIVMVVALLVIFAAVAFIVRGVRGPGKGAYVVETHMKCKECGAVYETKVSLKENFPVKCEKCGARAAYIALKCQDCGFVFCVEDFTDPESIDRCPACNDYNIGPVADP